MIFWTISLHSFSSGEGSGLPPTWVISCQWPGSLTKDFGPESHRVFCRFALVFSDGTICKESLVGAISCWLNFLLTCNEVLGGTFFSVSPSGFSSGSCGANRSNSILALQQRVQTTELYCAMYWAISPSVLLLNNLPCASGGAHVAITMSCNNSSSNQNSTFPH